MPRCIQQINSEPIGYLRNNQPSHVSQRFLVVKGRGEHTTDFGEKLLLRLNTLALSNIVSDVGDSDDLARAIVNRRDSDRHRQVRPILSSPRCFIEIDPFTPENLLHDPDKFILTIWRKEQGDGSAYHLLLTIAIHPLCGSIPTG